MKRILLILLFIINIGARIFANPVTFKFAAGTIDAGTLRTRMENNISELLSEINRARNNGAALDLTGIDMEAEAKVRLNALWNEAATK